MGAAGTVGVADALVMMVVGEAVAVGAAVGAADGAGAEPLPSQTAGPGTG